MKKGIVGLMLGMVLVCPAAQADIVEIRGKGIMNGKIVSQDAKQMTFKDASSGLSATYAKKDVLYSEVEKEVSTTEQIKKSAEAVLKAAAEPEKKPAPVPTPMVSPL